MAHPANIAEAWLDTNNNGFSDHTPGTSNYPGSLGTFDFASDATQSISFTVPALANGDYALRIINEYSEENVYGPCGDGWG